MIAARSIFRSATSATSATSAKSVGAFVGSIATPSLGRVAVRAYATNSARTVTQKSDAPWAIVSVLTFGSLFVYFTSPPSSSDHSHANHDNIDQNKQNVVVDQHDDAVVELEHGSIQHPQGFVQVNTPQISEHAPVAVKILLPNELDVDEAFEMLSEHE